MSEVLEGILSETLLDQIAEDLGIEPGVLRDSPFFRVIKGRVLLTYPLRQNLAMPLMQPVAEGEFEATETVWNQIVHELGSGIVYMAAVMDDSATKIATRDMKITLDGVEFESVSAGEQDATSWYYQQSLFDPLSLKTAIPATIYGIFQEEMKFEVKVEFALTAGEKVYGKMYYGLI